MKPSKRTRSAFAAGVLSLGTALTLVTSLAQQAAAPPHHAFFHVILDSSLRGAVITPVSGRLLLFIGPASPDGKVTLVQDSIFCELNG